MGKALTFILGGARSGKSTHAEHLAADAKRVAFVATAQAFDDDMAARIAAHRASRPAHWHTIEAPLSVGPAIQQAQASANKSDNSWEVVIVDCLTLLASNVLLAQSDQLDGTQAEQAMQQEIDALLAAYVASDAAWIIVSNEVGLGIVPDNALARVYRDLLGRVNQRLAAQADRVLLMVAGLPLRVK